MFRTPSDSRVLAPLDGWMWDAEMEAIDLTFDSDDETVNVVAAEEETGAAKPGGEESLACISLSDSESASDSDDDEESHVVVRRRPSPPSRRHVSLAFQPGKFKAEAAASKGFSGKPAVFELPAYQYFKPDVRENLRLVRVTLSL
ncbi:hypothetical protein P7C70_g2330, partial [Phenoliferia sp. Uapishka_3]